MLELDGIGKSRVGLLGLSMWQRVRVREKLNSVVGVSYIGTEAREEEYFLELSFCVSYGVLFSVGSWLCGH